MFFVLVRPTERIWTLYPQILTRNFELTEETAKNGALSLLSVTLITAVQVVVSPLPSMSAASMVSLYSGWI